jgi:hypothetical protein
MSAFIDTICLRCGYPCRVPKAFYNRISTCRHCLTQAEIEQKEKAREHLRRNPKEREKLQKLLVAAAHQILGRLPTEEEIASLREVHKRKN